MYGLTVNIFFMAKNRQRKVWIDIRNFFIDKRNSFMFLGKVLKKNIIKTAYSTCEDSEDR